MTDENARQASALIYVVESELRPESRERHEAWTRWYEDVHFPELLAVPGFVSATRYVGREAPWRSIAIYGITSPDVLQHPDYLAATGWGEWQSHIGQWTRAIYRPVPAPGMGPQRPD